MGGHRTNVVISVNEKSHVFLTSKTVAQQGMVETLEEIATLVLEIINESVSELPILASLAERQLHTGRNDTKSSIVFCKSFLISSDVRSHCRSRCKK